MAIRNPFMSICRSLALWAMAAMLAVPHVAAAAEPGASTPTVRVPVVKVQRKPLKRTIEQPATIEPYEVTPLYFRIPGYVSRVNVDLGDQIRGPREVPRNTQARPVESTTAGQPLAELAVPELEAELKQKESLVAQAKAELVQAQAAVRVAESGVTVAEADVAGAEAMVAGAKAAVDRCQSELKRFVALKESDAVTAKLVDESQAQLATARAAQQAAEAKVVTVKAAVDQSKSLLDKARADVAAAQARERVAEASLAQTRTMYDYRILTAPFDGVVTRRNMHTGHLVHAGSTGDPPLVVARTDVVRVVIEVPESDAGQVAAGAAVSLRFPALGASTIDAKITRTSWALDRTTRTLRAEVELPNPQQRYHAGMYAYATITSAERPAALVLPVSATFADKAQSFCAVVQEGVVRRRPVTLGVRAGTEVEIVSGLDDGTVVVSANGANFADGQAVQPISPP